MTSKQEADIDVRRAIQEILCAHDHEIGAKATQQLSLFGEIPSFDSPHKLTVAAASAIGAYALAVEGWWAHMKGERQRVGIDWMQAASALNPGQFMKQNGKALPAMAMMAELKNDFYQTKDSRWFFPVGPYPHLRDGVLELMDCANTPEALSRAFAKHSAEDLEQAFASQKLPGAYARTRQEWMDHPQGAWLATTPLIQIEKLADGPPESLSVGSRPLDHLRVLDLGHVIAGPVVARSLAEHGAQVLRLDPPLKQDPLRQTIDTNIGKRTAFIDLNDPVDQAKARQLMATADVVVQSWRHASLARRGFGPHEAAALRPGIVYVSVSAFGDEGPWAERGGFEQLGQTVSGLAINEGLDGRPSLVPTYLLNDYLTGYLGATGAMLALLRRAKEGGSYHVKVCLTRTSMWIQGLGLQTRDASLRGGHFAQTLNPVLERRMSAFGELEQLPPVAQFSRTPARWDLPPSPNGASLARWT